MKGVRERKRRQMSCGECALAQRNMRGGEELKTTNANM